MNTFLQKLFTFVEHEVTDKLLTEDLNYLLPADKFQKIRKVLKREVLMLIRDELTRLSQDSLLNK